MLQCLPDPETHAAKSGPRCSRRAWRPGRLSTARERKLSFRTAGNCRARPSGALSAQTAVTLLRRCVLASLLIVLISLVGAVQVPTMWPIWLTSRQVFLQDIWLAAALLAVAILALAASRLKVHSIELPRPAMIFVTIAIIIFCYAGHYLVLQGYDLTRDEQMVTFDAWIFSQGRLVWPIAAEWQPDAAALNLMFMLPIQHPGAWVSAYLPGNAAMHALIGRLLDPAFTAPLMTGLSLPLLWSLGRRLWPTDSEAAAIPLVLFALSGQVLLNGMTTYAMAAHLFWNLAWLRLFLAGRRSTDALALMIGFVATGLHQPLFHPLFVFPFLVALVVDRHWARLTLFALGYLAIGLFWLSWPVQMTALVTGPLSTATVGGSSYLIRLIETLGNSSHSETLMSANLLRFVTWQHVALLPLLLAAWPAVRRGGLPLALALGLALPVLVLAVILPWQGNGFGYRYLHPVLGNALLLAGYGWRELGPLRSRLRPAFVGGSVVTVFVMVPMWLAFSHARYAPYALASQTIDASGADYAVLQVGNGVSYGSVVFNRADLGNRPVRLIAERIADPATLARRICRPGVTVAVASDDFFRPGAAYFGTPRPDTASARLPALRAPYEAAGCRIILLR